MAKTYFHDGKWTEKTAKPKVLVCECGEKYIKTRPRQTGCLRCFLKKQY